jgi:hypothetical protein
VGVRSRWISVRCNAKPVRRWSDTTVLDRDLSVRCEWIIHRGSRICHRGSRVSGLGFSHFLCLAVLGRTIVDPLSSTSPLQMYMTFLNWRFSKRLLKYAGLVGPVRGGEFIADWSEGFSPVAG